MAEDPSRFHQGCGGMILNTFWDGPICSCCGSAIPAAQIEAAKKKASKSKYYRNEQAATKKKSSLWELLMGPDT